MPLWLVIDLEATTDEGGWPIKEMEIIEIGACLASEQGLEVDSFQSFIKPKRRPLLTPFCKQLTLIRQSEIDGAPSFIQAWQRLEQWLAPYHSRLHGWASWGEYDLSQLQQEWHQHTLDSSLAQHTHLNLKARFASQCQLEKPVGLKRALQLSGLNFQGQQHRALSDARNTARLLPLTLMADR